VRKESSIAHGPETGLSDPKRTELFLVSGRSASKDKNLVSGRRSWGGLVRLSAAIVRIGHEFGRAALALFNCQLIS